MSRAAGPAPTRPTTRSSPSRPTLNHAQARRLRHDPAQRAAAPPTIPASPPCSAATRASRLPRRQDLGFPRRGRARRVARRKYRDDRRNRSQHAATTLDEVDVRRRAFLRRLQGQSRLRARLRQGGASRPARAGSCCATPMAAPCRTRSSASSARSRSMCPATGSASTPITTPRTRSRTRWPRCAPARARCRAR